MHRLSFLLGASALALAACASDPVKRDPTVDPSNPDAPQSRPVRLADEFAAEAPAMERPGPSPDVGGSDPHAGHGTPDAGQPELESSGTTGRSGATSDAPKGTGEHDHGHTMDHGAHGAARGQGGEPDAGSPSRETDHSAHGTAQQGDTGADGGEAPPKQHRSHGGAKTGGARARGGAQPGSEHAAPGGSADRSGGPSDAGNEQAMYACPMHPEVRQRGPGRCPKCGMKLLPQAGAGGSDDAHRTHEGSDGGHR
jgi:hypothetical protein